MAAPHRPDDGSSDHLGDHPVNGNDVVAFFVEVGVLVLLAAAAWQVDAHVALRVTLAVLAPALAALLWGSFAAPRARVQSGVLRLATKVLVLGSGVVAAFVVLPAGWALLVALVIVVNLVLMYVGPFARRPVS